MPFSKIYGSGVQMPKSKCPMCGRLVVVTKDGKYVVHGPGPDSMTCSNSKKWSRFPV